MSRPLKTHAGVPTRPKVPLCREFATGARVLAHGAIVGALNATCVRCQHLLRTAALTPPTEDTMKQQHVNTAVECLIIHIAYGVAMRANPNTSPEAMRQQRIHVASSIDGVIAEMDGMGPNQGRSFLDTAVAAFWPDRETELCPGCGFPLSSGTTHCGRDECPDEPPNMY